MLSFGLDRLIAPYERMAPYERNAAEKCVAGRIADGRSGVVLVESHPFGRQAIEVRGLEMFLTEDAQIPVAEVASANT